MRIWNIIILLFVSGFILSSCNKREENEKIEGLSLTGNKIHWIGRTEYREEEQMMFFYFTATGFEVEFTGTYLEVEFYATNTANNQRRPYFTVSIDSQIPPDGNAISLTEDISFIKIAEGLKRGKHRASILKMSEPYDGYTAIKSIKTDGFFEVMEAKSNLRFQIIGASGISGHGALGEPSESRTTENSSSLHGFGYLTARMFGGETQFVANSGCGLVWGNRYEGIAKVYDYVGLADDQKTTIQSKWDHQSWIPDIVIVNIGGNDYTSYVSSLSGAESANARKLFASTVVSFIEHIHDLYPNVKIIWTHTGSTNGSDATNAIIDAGFNFVKVVIIPKVASDGDLAGANGHNGLATHIRTAQLLADEISSWLGVDQINDNIIMS
jgi:hypothetical protein